MSHLFPPGVELRPMQAKDTQRVLRIIAQVDEDDGAAARETYRRDLDGHYVLTRDGETIGVTGAAEAEGTDRAWWLSWTYLDSSHRGSGLGALMLQGLFAKLEPWNARKIFVSTSDYFDLDQGSIYQDALEAYQRAGFVEELRHPDYYDRNESLVTLGLRLQPVPQPPTFPPSHQRLARPTGYSGIPETEGAYFIDWEFTDDPMPGTQPWETALREISRRRGRVVFIGIAQDAQGVCGLVRQAGFREVGRLRDFYEDGVDEVHFRYDLM